MKYHLAFKFLAIILCALSLLTVITGAVSAISFVDMGLYSNSLEDLQDKQMSDDLRALAERMAVYYATKQTECTEAFINGYFAWFIIITCLLRREASTHFLLIPCSKHRRISYPAP